MLLFTGTLVAWLLRRDATAALDFTGCQTLFTLLGCGAFCLAIDLGLLVARGAETLGHAAVLDLLAPLGAGRRAAGGGRPDRRSPRGALALAGFRVAGTLVMLLGMVVLVAAVGLAWPQPAGLITVGTLNALALAAVAMRHRLPAVHLGAIASAGLVYLTGYHVLAGNLAWVVPPGGDRALALLLVHAESGAALIGLFALFLLAAEVLARLGRRAEANWYAGGAAAVALISLSITTIHAFVTGGGGPHGRRGLCHLHGRQPAVERPPTQPPAGLPGVGIGPGRHALDPLGPHRADWSRLVGYPGCRGPGDGPGRLGDWPLGRPRRAEGVGAVARVYRIPLLHLGEGLALWRWAGSGWPGPPRRNSSAIRPTWSRPVAWLPWPCSPPGFIAQGSGPGSAPAWPCWALSTWWFGTTPICFTSPGWWACWGTPHWPRWPAWG